jgi:hypothetical protein
MVTQDKNRDSKYGLIRFNLNVFKSMLDMVKPEKLKNINEEIESAIYSLFSQLCKEQQNF